MQSIAFFLMEHFDGPTRAGLLHHAAASANYPLVEALLDKGASIDAGFFGETALDSSMSAAPSRYGTANVNRSVCDLLVRRGAPVRQPSQLLKHACDTGDLELAEVCVARFYAPGMVNRAAMSVPGAGVDMWAFNSPFSGRDVNTAQRCLIIRALESRRSSSCDIALLLIDAGCPITPDAFVEACRAQKIEVIRAMLQLGADPNLATNTAGTDKFVGGFPLAVVCEANGYSIEYNFCDQRDSLDPPVQSASVHANVLSDVLALTAPGTLPPCQALISRTPHRNDITAPFSDIALLLLEHGAKVTRRAIIGAAKNRAADVIRTLLERKGVIDVNATGQSQQTALEGLCSRKSVPASMVELLIGHGCSVTVECFVMACSSGVSLECLRLLLDAGGRALLDAHVTIPSAATGISALGYSRLYERWSKAQGPSAGKQAAAVQSSVRALDTILLRACIDHSREATEMLLQRGAVVSLELLEYACVKRDANPMVLELILSSGHFPLAVLNELRPYDHDKRCGYPSRCTSRWRTHTPTRDRIPTYESSAAATHSTSTSTVGATLADIASDVRNSSALHVLLCHGAVLSNPLVSVFEACDQWQRCMYGSRLVRLLLRVGHVDINAARGPAGQSVLTVAVQSGHIRAVRMALRLGANINTADGSGKSALQIACDSQKKMTNMACFLLHHGASRFIPGTTQLIRDLPTAAEARRSAAAAGSDTKFVSALEVSRSGASNAAGSNSDAQQTVLHASHLDSDADDQPYDDVNCGWSSDPSYDPPDYSKRYWSSGY